MQNEGSERALLQLPRTCQSTLSAVTKRAVQAGEGTCAPDAVDIVLDLLRHVEVDDVLDCGEIQTLTCRGSPESLHWPDANPAWRLISISAPSKRIEYAVAQWKD